MSHPDRYLFTLDSEMEGVFSEVLDLFLDFMQILCFF